MTTKEEQISELRSLIEKYKKDQETCSYEDSLVYHIAIKGCEEKIDQLEHPENWTTISLDKMLENIKETENDNHRIQNKL